MRKLFSAINPPILRMVKICVNFFVLIKKAPASFKLIEGDTPPLEIDAWKLNWILDINDPSPQFVNFLRQCFKHLKDDRKTLRDQKIDGFINYFWRVSKSVKLYYLGLVVITYLL